MRRIEHIWKIVAALEELSAVPFVATRTAADFYHEAEERLHQERHDG